MVNASNELAIDLHHVKKVYQRKVHALRGIEMQVARGEIFGLLGPNGAGKTTLVKIMLTVIHPTRAGGTVLGRPIGHKPTLARVGYLPEDHRFPPYLTARQALEYYAALSTVGRAQRKRRTAELLDVVGMSEWADRPLRTFSKGMVQRVGLAQAMVHDPDLLILDEPTDGLDPIGRREIRGVLTSLRDQGKTIFINSHLLSELEMLCDRVAILNAGKVVRQGTLNELARDRVYYEIELGSGDLASAANLVRRCLARTLTVSLQNTCIRIEGADAEAIQPAIDALRGGGLVISAVRSVRPSLEDLFIETVTGSAPVVQPPSPPCGQSPIGPAAQGGVE